MLADAFHVTPAGGWAAGPTWARDQDGSWLLPAATLGWQALDWCSDNLVTPDGPRAGEPWEFTPEQARFLLHWYSLRPDGRFVYRDGTLRRLKGWGKDPFAAALGWLELLGPCRFGGWGEDGQPLAVPSHAPWVQIASVSQDATKNTTESLRPMIGGKDGARRLGVDLGKEVTYARSGRLEVVTSSPRSLEGNRPSFVVLGETHHWQSNNDGIELAATIRRNLAKNSDGSARGLAITNSHEPGLGSVAEADFDLWQMGVEGRRLRDDVLYDSLEAPPDTDLSSLESLRAGIVAARGDSSWVPVDRLVDEVLDPRTPTSQSRRFYLNQLVAADDSLFDMHHWHACRSDGALAPGEAVAMFFDGSFSEDTTALVACRLSDGFVEVLGHWNPADLGGEVPRDDVDATVARAFSRFDVVGFFADMRFWESYVDEWGRRYGPGLKVWAGSRSGRRAHAVAFDMRGRREEFSDAVSRFVVDVTAGELRHAGDARLDAHVGNCRRAVNRYGFTVRKESRDSSRKIDLAVCAIGARMVRQRAVVSGVAGERQRRAVFAF